MAFLRVDDKPINIRSRIQNPNCVVVLDAQLPQIVNVAAGLKEGSIAVLNTDQNPEDIDLGVKLSKIGVVDAVKIATEIYGRRPIPITNVIMMGALIATTHLVSLPSAIAAVTERFTGNLAKSNELAINTAYNSTKVVTYE
jgi:2-oxoacid:acceptor oxidoreductase gamma subunit (pyruvate/2-ketoisovalerate family)